MSNTPSQIFACYKSGWIERDQGSWHTLVPTDMKMVRWARFSGSLFFFLYPLWDSPIWPMKWLMMCHGDKKRSEFRADPPPILQSMGKEGGRNASEGNFHFYSIFLNFYPSILFLSQWGMKGMDNTCKMSFHLYTIRFAMAWVMFKVWPVLVTLVLERVQKMFYEMTMVQKLKKILFTLDFAIWYMWCSPFLEGPIWGGTARIVQTEW